MREVLKFAMLGLILVVPASPGIAAKSPKLARCDGHHRRSANPYGSILPTVDPLTGASTPASQSPGRIGIDVFPEKPPAAPRAGPKPPGPDAKHSAQVPPISRASPRTAFRSC